LLNNLDQRYIKKHCHIKTSLSYIWKIIDNYKSFSSPLGLTTKKKECANQYAVPRFKIMLFKIEDINNACSKEARSVQGNECKDKYQKFYDK
jgi:hypothetical protein